MGHHPASRLEGVGDLGEVALRVLLQPVGEAAGGPVGGAGGGGGEDQELLRPGGAGGLVRRRPLRRLLEDHVGVRAAEAEGADRRPPGRRAPGPVGGLGEDVERPGGEVDPGARGGEVRRRRQPAVLQGQHRLDQPGDAGGGVEVADVALHRAEHRGPRLQGPAGGQLVGLVEGGHLDRVPQLGGGAVPLDVAHRRRVDAGQDQGVADHRRLPLDARGGEADLVVAVVVHRRRQDHRAGSGRRPPPRRRSA